MFSQYIFQSSEGCGGFDTCITKERVIQIWEDWEKAANTDMSVQDFIYNIPEKDQIVDALGYFTNVLTLCKPDAKTFDVTNKNNFPSGTDMTWEAWKKIKWTNFSLQKTNDADLEKKRQDEETLRRCNKSIRVRFGFIMTLPRDLILIIFNKSDTIEKDTKMINQVWKAYSSSLEYLNIKTVKEANNLYTKLKEIYSVIFGEARMIQNK